MAYLYIEHQDTGQQNCKIYQLFYILRKCGETKIFISDSNK